MDVFSLFKHLSLESHQWFAGIHPRATDWLRLVSGEVHGSSAFGIGGSLDAIPRAAGCICSSLQWISAVSQRFTGVLRWSADFHLNFFLVAQFLSPFLQVRYLQHPKEKWHKIQLKDLKTKLKFILKSLMSW
ncbi:hypothetical protein HAX54_017313 [Datura stramonium]|uniref:Uncharacterized protein n=1 Tax=Datura stramonium TaxID=4076 RepID=A0ABS8ULZ9_DATST|nr:hypothetical protein [Datura stramonium]